MRSERVESIEFSIMGNPVTKKNHSQVIMRGKYPMVVPSKAYQKFEKNCNGQIPRLEINEPCNIKAIYYMATRRKVDITNLHSALHDVLVKYGCIADDNCHIVVATDGSRIAYDKENPRIEVTIEFGYEDPFI